jgi:hypothetical protein
MLLEPRAIAELSDEAVEQAIVDIVAARIRQSDGPAIDSVMALPVGYRVVYATWVLEVEVANGGFLQYFYNSRGHFIDEAADGLELLEAMEHLAIFDAAVVRVTDELERLGPFWQQGTLDGFAASYKVSALDEFDEKWFKLGGLSRARLAYIRRTTGDFEPGSDFV